MRTLLIAAVAAMALLAIPAPSAAQRGGDGCGIDEYGRTVCRPGARPGVPYRAGGGDGCGIDRYGRTVCRPGARPGVPYGGGYGYDGRVRGGGYVVQGGPQAVAPGYYVERPRRRPPVVSDGCGTDRFGRTVCRPGARPGVPYGGPY
jgi:hypothetical protein